MPRPPLASLLTRFGDFDGRRDPPTGWTHLPATNPDHDARLLAAAAQAGVVHARVLVRLIPASPDPHKEYCGVLVPAKAAERIAQAGYLEG